jgi:hypothetical protein
MIREIAGTHGTGFGLTAKPDEVEAKTLAALQSSVAILEAKAPAELDAYRSLVLVSPPPRRGRPEAETP